jgi:hypothetical protein
MQLQAKCKAAAPSVATRPADRQLVGEVDARQGRNLPWPLIWINPTRTYYLDYEASIAQWHAERRTRRPKVAKQVGNERLRQYFPKGTDLSLWSAAEIEAVAHALNGRPRKTLGRKTPAEALNEQLMLVLEPGVATID